MTEQKLKSVFYKVVDIKGDFGNLKSQVTIDVQPYDSSTMEGYKAGSKVYTGYTCKIQVQKFGYKPKVTFTNFDPLEEEIEDAIKSMYEKLHQLVNPKSSYISSYRNA